MVYIVPSFGIGPEFLAALKDKVSTPMDAHLMIKHPQQYLETFAKAGAAYYYAPHRLHRGRCFRNESTRSKNLDVKQESH